MFINNSGGLPSCMLLYDSNTSLNKYYYHFFAYPIIFFTFAIDRLMLTLTLYLKRDIIL